MLNIIPLICTYLYEGDIPQFREEEWLFSLKYIVLFFNSENINKSRKSKKNYQKKNKNSGTNKQL